MSEFEEKLNALLSNPDAMAQVASLAQSLNLGGSSGDGGSRQPQGGESPAPPSPPPPSGVQSGLPGGLGALSGLGDLLGQIDPKTIQRLLPLVSELTNNSASDQRMQLLYALQPFLKPERRDKVERAAKAAKLLHVGKKLLTTMGDPNV